MPPPGGTPVSRVSPCHNFLTRYARLCTNLPKHTHVWPLASAGSHGMSHGFSREQAHAAKQIESFSDFSPCGKWDGEWASPYPNAFPSSRIEIDRWIQHTCTRKKKNGHSRVLGCIILEYITCTCTSTRVVCIFLCIPCHVRTRFPHK